MSDNIDKIIERLLDVNEKRSHASDVKFYIACILLLLSLGGNIYQATKDTEVIFDANQNIESSINQTNG